MHATRRHALPVLGYGQIPDLVLDATTGAEDRTSWSSEGFDAPAMLSAAIETLL